VLLFDIPIAIDNIAFCEAFLLRLSDSWMLGEIRTKTLEQLLN
jgi:hypothetical protein